MADSAARIHYHGGVAPNKRTDEIRVLYLERTSDPDKTQLANLEHARFPGLYFDVRFRPGGELQSFTTARGAHAPPLTARQIREVPIGAICDVARSVLIERIDSRAADTSLTAKERRALRKVAERWAADFAEQPRTGPKGRDLHDYALLAAQYVELLGHPNPVEMLAERLHLSVQQTRNLVWQARRRGLLTPVRQGRAGGNLTETALALLREARDGTR